MQPQTFWPSAAWEIYFPSPFLVNIPVFYSPARQSRVSLGSMGSNMGSSIFQLKAGGLLMARKRNTGSRQALEPRRVRAWRKLKNGYQKARAIDWSNWIRAGAAVITVLLTFWTNSIRQKADETAKKLSELQAAVVLKDAKHESEMVKLNSDVGDCKKQWQQQMKQIEDEAKKLPSSPQKRKILNLTKQEPLKQGAQLEPLRANDSIPAGPERPN